MIEDRLTGERSVVEDTVKNITGVISFQNFRVKSSISFISQLSDCVYCYFKGVHIKALEFQFVEIFSDKAILYSLSKFKNCSSGMNVKDRPATKNQFQIFTETAFRGLILLYIQKLF